MVKMDVQDKILFLWRRKTWTTYFWDLLYHKGVSMCTNFRLASGRSTWWADRTFHLHSAMCQRRLLFGLHPRSLIGWQGLLMKLLFYSFIGSVICSPLLAFFSVIWMVSQWKGASEKWRHTNRGSMIKPSKSQQRNSPFPYSFWLLKSWAVDLWRL